MKLTDIPASWLLALAALAAGAVWLMGRQSAAGGGSAATELGAAVGSAAVDAAGGLVLGVGDALGVPRTEPSACAAALQAGEWWDASFACPAGDFLGAVIGGANVNTGSVSGSW